MLADRAQFDEGALAFDLDRPPREDIPRGRYHLISKSQPLEADGGAGEPSRFLYRLSHPLGEHVIEQGKTVATPAAEIAFDVTSHPARLAVVEALRGQRGYLTLSRLTVDSYDREEYLLLADAGGALDQETMEKLFLCSGRVVGADGTPEREAQRLAGEAERQPRRQRQEIFAVEDEIMLKRGQLIDQLEQRLAQRTATETLFTIRWAVV